MSRTRNDTVGIFVQLFCILILLALLSGVLFSEAARRAQSWYGEHVGYATVKQTCGATAYFFRSEATVEGVDNGPVLYHAASGDTVAVGDAVATVYADGANVGTRRQASRLLAEIERLEAALGTALPDYYGAYGALMRDLSSGRLPTNRDATETVIDALDKRDAATSGEAYRARIAALRAELDELVKNDRDAYDTATVGQSGVFYRRADGYEGVMTPSALETLTVGGLRALLASPQDTQKAVGKVVYDTACYFAVILPAAHDYIVVNGTYSVSLLRAGLTVNATLDRMSEADGDGNALFVFSFEDSGVNTAELRFAEIEIALGEVTGLSLPCSAVYEEDGALVVYVEKNGAASKRVVTPVYQKDGCLLVAEEELLAGDVVVCSTRRVYDGRVLR